MRISRFRAVSSAVLGGMLLLGCAENQKQSPSASAAGTPAKGDSKSVESCEVMEANGMATKATGQKVAAGVHYGPQFKLAESDTVPAAKVLANPAEYDGKTLRISGTVASVCQVKGCWLTIGDSSSDETLFVKFVDPPAGRLVPMEAAGHEITAEGTFKVGQISQAFARELKRDAGASKEEVEKVTGPQKTLMLLKPAVTITGVEPTKEAAAE